MGHVVARACLSRFLRTMSAEPSRGPAGPDRIHEIKHDGFRLLARRGAERVRLFTRNGHDWTERFPADCRGRGYDSGWWRQLPYSSSSWQLRPAHSGSGPTGPSRKRLPSATMQPKKSNVLTASS